LYATNGKSCYKLEKGTAKRSKKNSCLHGEKGRIEKRHPSRSCVKEKTDSEKKKGRG